MPIKMEQEGEKITLDSRPLGDGFNQRCVQGSLTLDGSSTIVPDIFEESDFQYDHIAEELDILSAEKEEAKKLEQENGKLPDYFTSFVSTFDGPQEYCKGGPHADACMLPHEPLHKSKTNQNLHAPKAYTDPETVFKVSIPLRTIDTQEPKYVAPGEYLHRLPSYFSRWLLMRNSSALARSVLFSPGVGAKHVKRNGHLTTQLYATFKRKKRSGRSKQKKVLYDMLTKSGRRQLNLYQTPLGAEDMIDDELTTFAQSAKKIRDQVRSDQARSDQAAAEKPSSVMSKCPYPSLERLFFQGYNVHKEYKMPKWPTPECDGYPKMSPSVEYELMHYSHHWYDVGLKKEEDMCSLGRKETIDDILTFW